MENTTINLEQDSEAAVSVSDENLKVISSLIDVQLGYERKIENIEADLEDAKKNLKIVMTERLPEALRQAGVTEFTTTDFYQVKLNDVYFANIKDENKDDAFKWLFDNEHGDIIKNDVNLSFGKGEDALATQAMSILSNVGFSPTNKKHIHWQTLRAFVKEQMTKGVNMPESIDVHVVPTSKIKRK